jgi:hypothetical protein
MRIKLRLPAGFPGSLVTRCRFLLSEAIITTQRHERTSIVIQRGRRHFVLTSRTNLAVRGAIDRDQSAVCSGRTNGPALSLNARSGWRTAEISKDRTKARQPSPEFSRLNPASGPTRGMAQIVAESHRLMSTQSKYQKPDCSMSNQHHAPQPLRATVHRFQRMTTASAHSRATSTRPTLCA